MMTWGYRVLRFAEHDALHEVHFDEDGTPWGYTAEPASFVADLDQEGQIATALSMALADAKRHAVLIVSELWPDA